MLTTQRTITILLPDDTDLRATVAAFAKVCHELSPICFNGGANLSSLDLHKVAYATIKGSVSAQMTSSAIRSVASAYQSARSNKRPATEPFAFAHPIALFAIGARGRDAEFKGDDTLSIWTVSGRKRITYEVPKHFRQRFDDAIRYDSLTVIERNGRLLGRLCITLQVPDRQGTHPVGIDLNETNALVAVDGEDNTLFVSGREVKTRNRRTRKTRKRLQSKLSSHKAQKRDTRSVRRALKRLGKKARNRTLDFVRNAACLLVKWVPEDAILVWEKLNLRQPKKGTIKGPAIRRRLSLWQRRLLREACSNKAQLLGIPEMEVNPAYTSKNCSRCGKRGVRKRHCFNCKNCGHSEHADINAGRNIRNRGTHAESQGSVGSPSMNPEAQT